MAIIQNATGWTQLYAGNPISAVWTMYAASWGLWLVPILFFVFQAMLFIKTRNATACFIMGLFFAAIFATGYGITVFMEQSSVPVLFALLTLEFTGIVFVWFMK